MNLPVLDINATISLAALTTGNLPFFDWRINSFASVNDKPSLAENKWKKQYTQLSNGKRTENNDHEGIRKDGIAFMSCNIHCTQILSCD